MLKKTRRKILESKLNLMDLHIRLQRDILESLMTITDLLKNMQFNEAAGAIFKIYELGDVLEKQIRIHVTQEILPIFETEAKLSYSLEEVERKRDAVFKWLSEVKHLAKQLQNKLRAYKKDPEKIYHDFDRLHEKICCDLSLMDFVNTLRFLVSEFEIHQYDKSMDRLTSIFNNLKLHPIIKKSSKKLFRDGHYSSAILEGYKALINYVKEKSGKKTLPERDLMGNVFDVKYTREPLELTKEPILKLNELNSLEEIDEQKGFMHLFLGAVIGIRNPKAHAIIEQRDPFKTLEYLSLASLLAKRVDEAKIKR